MENGTSGDEKEYLPNARGFDEMLIHGAGGIGQTGWGDFPVNEEECYFDNVLLHNEEIVQTKGFCTDLFFPCGTGLDEGQDRCEGALLRLHISSMLPTVR